MDIHEATVDYERWLGSHVHLVPADLKRKHVRMREAVFPFMRGTFYRWCQLWRELAASERTLVSVRAIGDLHLENFGTWRDVEGRLVWGINDFDEATRLPWSQDLARLATSAHLAIADEHLQVRRRDACAAILDGYREGLDQGPRPFALEERNTWLRRVATSDLRDPTAFWAKMEALRTARAPDASAVAALRDALPEPAAPPRICRRVAGMGSLGRPRFVALADWRGGRVAREAKAWAPSAWVWAARQAPPRAAARAAVRSPDPTVHLAGRWLVRRLAPHCTRIELGDLPRERDEERLLRAMGFETANVHLETRGAAEGIRRELRARVGARWLDELARVLARALEQDWRAWRGG
jgi:Uncharacterized protein conserved in bacteria (DUF2252)